jgi:hypothetical protein
MSSNVMVVACAMPQTAARLARMNLLKIVPREVVVGFEGPAASLVAGRVARGERRRSDADFHGYRGAVQSPKRGNSARHRLAAASFFDTV